MLASPPKFKGNEKIYKIRKRKIEPKQLHKKKFFFKKIVLAIPNF